MRRVRNLKKPVFWTLLLTFGLWTITAPGQSDSELPLNSTDTTAISSDAPDASPQKATITADKQEENNPTFMETVDQMAGTAVEHIASILFLRVGSSEQESIQYKDVDYFYRNTEDSGTDFTALQDKELQLSQNDIQAGIKAGIYNERAIATGTLQSEGAAPLRVEFVSRTIKEATYIKDANGTFRAQEPMLSKLSKDDTLSDDEITAALAENFLVLTDEGEHVHIGNAGGMPIVVLWLACGEVFFTIYMRGVNIWGFKHAIEVVRGKYDNPEEEGEVTHMQALASALSATVGLGNIAGVTIAMTMGGPGAFFWVMMCGFFGMTSKFVECTLGQKYRRIKDDGSVLGGPMAYLPAGLSELSGGPLGVFAKPLGVILGVLFTFMCIMGSFGGGNMFQSNQAGSQLLTIVQEDDRVELASLSEQIKVANEANDSERVLELDGQREALKKEMNVFADNFSMGFGLVMAALVAVVIIGGIKSIGKVAEKIVPAMCLIYVLACLYVILAHVGEIPSLIGMIFTEAFNPQAFGGGLVGVLVIGVQRAAFSNEAGVGSAAIVHSAAKTEEPIREGTVALLEPFIDTIVVCSMTALVILITGAWNNADWIVEQGLAGTQLTSEAFESVLPWFPYILTLAGVLFAFSTMISWSYYGERCWESLFGGSFLSVYTYKAIFIMAVFVGAIIPLGAVLDFSDMMILCMAFPNVLGLIFLSPKVRRDLLDYWHRYKSGKFTTYK
ncbi:MAG: alanine:cation symporter family protein [Pirellulales bacterium]|nr:alanine:cation symporter family protein [Pirellulales bacterium]